MSIKRTEFGSQAEYLFYPEVLVYVEGVLDIPFYTTVLSECECSYRIKAKDGKPAVMKQADLLKKNNSPYVTIIDGDYEILEKPLSKHNRVIILERYSVESYLSEKDPIMLFAGFSAKKKDSKERPITHDELTQFLEEVEENLMELLVLDVARHRSSPKIGKYLDIPEKFYDKTFKNDEIKKKLEKAMEEIKEESINEARILVNKYLKQNRFIDLLPGHFAFGLICNFVKQKMGKGFKFDSIWLFLSTNVPIQVKTQHHIRLQERLYSAVREAEEILHN